MKYQVGDTIFRHGDVLLKKSDKPIPEGKAISRGVLHKGNNHSHNISGEHFVVTINEKRYLAVVGVIQLYHEEHGAITIKPRRTLLEIDIQREYDHFLEESRQVID